MPAPVDVERPKSVWQHISGGRVLGVNHAIGCYTNASRGLSATAEFLDGPYDRITVTCHCTSYRFGQKVFLVIR